MRKRGNGGFTCKEGRGDGFTETSRTAEKGIIGE
jgi:hypothetical protein